ncbi:LapA family protein [bacterium]|nr:LapA family protein [bacterium]
MQSINKLMNILIFVVLFIIFVTFAMQNNQQMAPVTFFMWQSPNMPIWTIIFISMIIGTAIGFVLTVSVLLNANREKKKLLKDIKTTKAELNRMRNVSIDEEIEEDTLAVKQPAKPKKSKTEAQ